MIDYDGVAKRLDDAMTANTPTYQGDDAMPIADAYQIQRRLVSLREGRGERLTGYKMGFTSRAKMAQMGVDAMIFGRLTDAMQLEEGASSSHARFIHPRAEPEIAFLISKPISRRLSLVEALSSVEWIAPAVEIIDSRYANFKFSLSDVISDNSSSAGFVVGNACRPDLDIGNLGMLLAVNGRVEQIGSSAAILGNPWRSLVAASQFAQDYESTIELGQILLAGAATAAVPVPRNGRVSLETQDMGSLQFRLE